MFYFPLLVLKGITFTVGHIVIFSGLVVSVARPPNGTLSRFSESPCEAQGKR